MPQYGFDHLHLISSNGERAARFYENSFGAKRVAVTKASDGNTSIELDLYGVRILIREIPGRAETKRDSIGESYGLEHFGIGTDNIEATVASLKSAGVSFRDEIREPRPDLKIAFFWAPDNVLIELMERK